MAKNYLNNSYKNFKQTEITGTANQTIKTPTNTNGVTQNNNVKDILQQYANASDPSKKSLANSSIAQYDEIARATEQAKQQSYVQSQQANKYSQNILEKNGLANTGQQVTNQNAISNNYMNNIQSANQNQMSQNNNILKDYYSGLETVDISNQEQSYGLAESELNNATSVQEYDEILSKYKGQVNDYQYKQLELAVNAAKLRSVVSDPISQTRNGEAINVADYDVNSTDFKKFVKSIGHKGRDKVGSGQYKLIQDVIQKAQSGQISDGEIYNFNYGKGDADNYVYFQGRFYKVD